jgi:hypothetical protein
MKKLDSTVIFLYCSYLSKISSSEMMGIDKLNGGPRQQAGGGGRNKNFFNENHSEVLDGTKLQLLTEQIHFRDRPKTRRGWRWQG